MEAPTTTPSVFDTLLCDPYIYIVLEFLGVGFVLPFQLCCKASLTLVRRYWPQGARPSLSCFLQNENMILYGVRDQFIDVSDADVSVYAARNGLLESLKFMRNMAPPCSLDPRVARAAAHKGHFDMLKWLVVDERCPLSASVAAAAAANGHFGCLKWLLSSSVRCPWDAKLYGCITGSSIKCISIHGDEPEYGTGGSTGGSTGSDDEVETKVLDMLQWLCPLTIAHLLFAAKPLPVRSLGLGSGWLNGW
jgi:hypothetical protein